MCSVETSMTGMLVLEDRFMSLKKRSIKEMVLYLKKAVFGCIKKALSYKKAVNLYFTNNTRRRVNLPNSRQC